MGHVNGVTEIYGLKERNVETRLMGHPKGITIHPLLCKAGVTPRDHFEWAEYSAEIKNDEGKVIFKQDGIQAPISWSQQAVNIVASKYFRGHPGTPEREDSVDHMVERIVRTITGWGHKDGYFATTDDANNFYRELTYIHLNQMACFNSPVWFNVGLRQKPQCSACFILKIEDNMESILNWYKEEGMIFKGGSGAGINLSPLRAAGEKCEDHGRASGPISFMRAADASAGVIKSGGKTRRAAKMVILNVDHPDIMKFIECKVLEERKARALEAAGYSGGMDGEATTSVFYQNANNSVRVTDDFMRMVELDAYWQLFNVTDHKEVGIHLARNIFHHIAECAWECGDPGIQFDTTINDWHTCPNSGRINASNPCSEYMHLDNSACNLASLNLMKFIDEDRRFDIEAFQHVVRIMITAMDILIDNSSYPTLAIAKTAHEYRQLGLGFANLGAFLMYNGIPYDSDDGRNYAAEITSLMTAEAYKQSTVLASGMGPFVGFEKNKEAMTRVLLKHKDAHKNRNIAGILNRSTKQEIGLGYIWSAANVAWSDAIQQTVSHGSRNSQTVVIAPTGTIAFMMDCDTTGIEPAPALTMTKHLAGGGDIEIFNQTVAEALKWLGYSNPKACHPLPQHQPIFQTAFGSNPLRPEAHVLMMAAVQPFVSGAISKTVNLPAEATVEDVERIYMLAWKEGLKSVAIYRDGSKTTQPLTTTKEAPRSRANAATTVEVVQSLMGPTVTASAPARATPKPYRHKMPDDRNAITHKFEVGGHEGYLTVGLYEDGTPGELFVTMSQQGSTISGLIDAFATAISFALQYGVPLEFLAKKFKNTRFEPAGFTKHPTIRQSTSIVDYIFQYLEHRFMNGHVNGNEAFTGMLKNYDEIVVSALTDWKRVIMEKGYVVFERSPLPPDAVGFTTYASYASNPNYPPIDSPLHQVASGMLCRQCGSIMNQSGSCFTCSRCGFNSGCG